MRVCARAPTSSGARSPHPDARWTRASPPSRCQHDSAEVVVVPAVEDIDVRVAVARVDSVTMEKRRQVRMSAHSIPAQPCSSNARSHPESGLRLEIESHYRTTFISLIGRCRRPPCPRTRVVHVLVSFFLGVLRTQRCARAPPEHRVQVRQLWYMGSPHPAVSIPSPSCRRLLSMSPLRNKTPRVQRLRRHAPRQHCTSERSPWCVIAVPSHFTASWYVLGRNHHHCCVELVTCVIAS